ncbi:putative membrane protein hemolysin III [Serinicoccus hydrothermalis]|uniref:Putative membrane protein hemolysin III n=1 Tax=Serinicoccus hydrothermalis TaxID=1758689 RepID=A0A1B1NDD8_9MICO|nr:hemolysin III family protein [Serinicoccus hydrothermalis]ANS79424.1 putative membrane protein hemolysin III [Serinicoccus hydrothermalis]
METVQRSRDGSVHVTDERINTISHLVASCFAVLGSALLISQAAVGGDPWRVVGLSVYAASLVTLFVASTAHHGLDQGPKVNEVLRTLDYTSVFFLIAGTVTPLVLVLDRTAFGWAVLGTVWGIAALGIAARSVWRELPKWVTNTLYIVLGWMPVVLVLGGMDLPVGALALMAAGGVVYSVGFVIFIVERPNPVPGVFGFHEIWHLLVAIAATFHFLLMYLYLL